MGMIISLEEARTRLGRGVAICLEPEDRLDAALERDLTRTAYDEAAGNARAADALWVFDPATGRSRRGDSRFFDVRVVDRGGWNQLALYEEPAVLAPPFDNEYRVVGHVIVEVNPNGRIRARSAKGLNGEMLELKSSSISKGELATSGATLVGYFEANPQRIMGYIAVYRHEVDFPDEEGMTPGDFKTRSTDGRSLAALAKCGW